jgi:DNA ligase-1
MLLNNEPTLCLSFRERRQLLRDHFRVIKNRFALVQAIDATASQECQDEVSDFFKKSINDGCEGIMVKVLDHTGRGGNNVVEADGQNATEIKRVIRQTKSSQLLATYEPGTSDMHKYCVCSSTTNQQLHFYFRQTHGELAQSQKGLC